MGEAASEVIGRGPGRNVIRVSALQYYDKTDSNVFWVWQQWAIMASLLILERTDEAYPVGMFY